MEKREKGGGYREYFRCWENECVEKREKEGG